MHKLFQWHGIAGAAALILTSLIAVVTGSFGSGVFVVFLAAFLVGIYAGFAAGHNALMGAMFSVALLTFGLVIGFGTGPSAAVRIVAVLAGLITALGCAAISADEIKEGYGGKTGRLMTATLSLPIAVLIGIGLEWLTGWAIAWVIGLLYAGLMYWLASRVKDGTYTFGAGQPGPPSEPTEAAR